MWLVDTCLDTAAITFESFRKLPLALLNPALGHNYTVLTAYRNPVLGSNLSEGKCIPIFFPFAMPSLGLRNTQ